MKILHISDLHLGIRLCEFSLIEEQSDILDKIIAAADEEKPDCVVIAGDIYNRAVPQAEAVRLFDDFLYKLSQRHLETFVISGNHDSAERIAFGGRIMKNGGIHMSPVYSGKVEPVTLMDEFGEVNFYLLPFIKPVDVRRYHRDCDIPDYNTAVKVAVEAMDVDTAVRNVIVTHQFITGAQLSESEELLVGGTENVDAAVFADFDYAALGHIHRPQSICGGKLRYCGTPLKYSLSEVGTEKSLTVAELGKKGELSLRSIPLIPLRDVKEFKGTYEKLTDKSFYGNINVDDYIFLTLTDEADIPDAVRKLRKIYPRLCKLRYDNSRTREPSLVISEETAEKLPPSELFRQFYEQQNNHPMTEEQRRFVEKIIGEVWEEELL